METRAMAEMGNGWTLMGDGGTTSTGREGAVMRRGSATAAEHTEETRHGLSPGLLCSRIGHRADFACVLFSDTLGIQVKHAHTTTSERQNPTLGWGQPLLCVSNEYTRCMPFCSLPRSSSPPPPTLPPPLRHPRSSSAPLLRSSSDGTAL